MLLKLLALFIIVPLVELWILLVLARHTGLLRTFLVVIGTGVLGTLLARMQGWRTMRAVQSELARGRLPTEGLLDAAMIFVAGALLLTPGLLTDALGLSLLIPFFRRRYRAALARWFRARFQVVAGGTDPAEDRSRVIDVKISDSAPPDHPHSTE